MKKVLVIVISLILLAVITDTDIVARMSGQSEAYKQTVEIEEEEEKQGLLDKMIAAVKGFLLPPDTEEQETVIVENDTEEESKTVAPKPQKEKSKREEPIQTAESVSEEEDWQEEDTTVEELIGNTDVSGAYSGAAAHNVQLACDLNNEVVIYPGGVYSAFDYLGDGGEDMGFEAATGLLSDGTTTDMFGSGICTVTTAIFQAGRSAGLSILEVKDHIGAESSYAAAGNQAMFNYPDSDLKMRNDFDYPVVLYMGYYNGVIYAEWYSQKNE